METSSVSISVSTPEEIGRLTRAVRQAEAMRLDDAAGALGVSDVFLWKLEKGSGGIRLDKLLQVLRGLGVKLTADVSVDAAQRYRALQEDRRQRVSNPAGKRTRTKKSTTVLLLP